MVIFGLCLICRWNKRIYLVKKKILLLINKYYFFFKFKIMMIFIFYLFLGVLECVLCGLKFGWGEGYENFNGCIDEVRFVVY